MRKITSEELKVIIDRHQHWIKEDVEDWENMRADLREADLSEANLSEAILWKANLSRANLFGANLSRANLFGADLSEADLREADLSEANLSEAILWKANLSRANLFGANLNRANLFGANLFGANFSEAILWKANLSRANLFGANLFGANLSEADLSEADLWKDNLSEADLREAKNIPYIPMVCPDNGSFIGWKKCLFTATDLKDNQCRRVIVKLLIPDDAKRSSSTGRKCRCSKAKILEFQDYDGNVLDVLKVRSRYQPDFIYKIGETIEINDFDEDRWNECSSGIHFFINRQEAVEYLI